MIFQVCDSHRDDISVQVSLVVVQYKDQGKCGQVEQPLGEVPVMGTYESHAKISLQTCHSAEHRKGPSVELFQFRDD